LNSGLGAAPPVPFGSGYFGHGGVTQIICPGCSWTLILLISASQVARITSMSHEHPVY
jgi:hypothetical protein